MTIALHQVKPSRRQLDIARGHVDLSHGSGGRAMAQLIAGIFYEAFDNDSLRQGNDQAAFDVEGGRMVMSTDSYVVSPLFFPGGDIGSLAVHGTINDIAMAGARPLHLSASFIIEEGFTLADLQRIASSMGEASRTARRACRSSPVTPRSSSAARRTACSSPRPASASCRPGSICPVIARGRVTW
jgi:hydrogenase expression/formation protein HypE